MCILWVNPVKLRKEVYFQCLWNIWLITDNPYFQVHASRFDFPTGAPYNGTLDVWEFQTIKHMFKKKKKERKEERAIVLHFLCYWNKISWTALFEAFNFMLEIVFTLIHVLDHWFMHCSNLRIRNLTDLLSQNYSSPMQNWTYRWS